MNALILALALVDILKTVKDVDPPVIEADLQRFPGFDCWRHKNFINEQEYYYRLQAELQPWNHELSDTLLGWQHRLRAWNNLHSARCFSLNGNIHSQLNSLSLLRQEIGREAWYAGRMP